MLATVIRFEVFAVDGECLPIPGVEIGARFHYADAPSSWDCATTDGDGVASFVGEHPEPPTETALFVADEMLGIYAVGDHERITIEL